MIPGNRTKTPPAIVLWVLWCAFASALVVYRNMLAGKAADTHSITAPDTIPAWLCFAIPIMIVLPLRWLVIPRLRTPFLVLPVFLVSVAFAEALTFFGLFLFPAQFSFFYIASWLMLVQVMPLWTLRPGPPAG